MNVSRFLNAFHVLLMNDINLAFVYNFAYPLHYGSSIQAKAE